METIPAKGYLRNIFPKDGYIDAVIFFDYDQAPPGCFCDNMHYPMVRGFIASKYYTDADSLIVYKQVSEDEQDYESSLEDPMVKIHMVIPMRTAKSVSLFDAMCSDLQKVASKA